MLFSRIFMIGRHDLWEQSKKGEEIYIKNEERHKCEKMQDILKDFAQIRAP